MSRYLEQRLRQSGLGGQMGRAEEFLLALPNRTMRIPVIAKTMVTIVTRDGLHLANGSGVGAEMGRYHFVEGIALADCAIDVEGAGVADLFETARRRAN
jgi:hypothetical protein